MAPLHTIGCRLIFVPPKIIDSPIFWGYRKGLKITYDPNKRNRTLEERGLDFEDAPKVFAGRTFRRPAAPRADGEKRIITAGYLDGRFVVMVWTQRGDARHIISMRHAHAKEERSWIAAAQ